jgi:two-component system sensor histidine kinase MprB
MTYRRRVALLTAVAVAGAILVASAVIYAFVHHSLHAEVDQTLQDASPRLVVVGEKRTAPAPKGTSGGSTGAAEANDRGTAPSSSARGTASAGGTTTTTTTTESADGSTNSVASSTRPAPPSDGAVLTTPDQLADIEMLSQSEPGGPKVRVLVRSTVVGGATPIAQVVTDPGNTTFAAGGGPDAVILPVSAAVRRVAEGHADGFYRTTVVKGIRLRILTVRDPTGATVQIARALTDTDQTLSNLRLTLLVVALLGGGFAALLGLLVARGVLGPVARLTRTAEDVSATLDLSHRIDESGNDELSRLAHTFNRMLSALSESRDAQRQLVADASHELRTPLTSIRTNIELLLRAPDVDPAERRAMLENAGQQLQELTVLVGDLVDLARPQGSPTDDPEPLRLDALVDEAVVRARRHAGDVTIDLDAKETTVVGSPARLHRAVSNLLDNAIKWSPVDGVVEVAVRDGEVTVRDHGPGIAEADLPHVFERFWRTADARGLPGSGLGLAIVKQVADTHGGFVTVERAEGGGTLVRLQLPGVSEAQASAADRGDPVTEPAS